MRISDWSSDVCSSDLLWILALASAPLLLPVLIIGVLLGMVQAATSINEQKLTFVPKLIVAAICLAIFGGSILVLLTDFTRELYAQIPALVRRSEEHTSELQSLMSNSYDVFCLKKKQRN